MGELENQGFRCDLFFLVKIWSGHNINVTLTPETQIARDETVVQTIDATYFLGRGGEYYFCQILCMAKED